MDQLVSTPGQLAAVLRARRTALGLTQRAAGSEVGLLAKTISGLESSPERSQLGSLYKLLSALDLELVVRPKSTRPSGHAW